MKKLFFMFAVLALPCASSGQEYPPDPSRRGAVCRGRRGRHLRAHARAELSEAFKQGFVVENKPGANGGIGADFVAKSAPTGTRCSPRERPDRRQPGAVRQSAVRPGEGFRPGRAGDRLPIRPGRARELGRCAASTTSSRGARQARRGHLRLDGLWRRQHTWRVSFWL